VLSQLSRTQVFVYAALAVAMLAAGARAIESETGDSGFAAASSGGGSSGGSADGGGFRLGGGGGPDVALRRAGGAASGAALEAINLAARLADGQQVLVPKVDPSGAPVAAASAAAEEGPISLGSATVEQLETIDGIGPVTAGDIVEFRDQHGGLSSVDQLNQVPGIGPATMEALRARLQP
jgi:competence protein ComEA